MRNLCLLLLVCLAPMLAFCQTDGLNILPVGGYTNALPSHLMNTSYLGAASESLQRSPAGSVTLMPSNWNLGTVPRLFPYFKTFVLNNGGSGRITIDSITVNRTPPLSIISTQNSCQPHEQLPANGQCNIEVEFQAEGTGGTGGMLTVDTSAGNLQSTITAMATYDATLNALDGCNLDLKAGKRCDITMQNNEPISLSISSIKAKPQDFALVTYDCPLSPHGHLSPSGQPGDSCTVTVTATGSGGTKGTLTVTDSSLDQSPPQLTLSCKKVYCQ